MKLDHYRSLKPVQLCLPANPIYQELAPSGSTIVDEGEVRRHFGARVRVFVKPQREGGGVTINIQPALTAQDLPVVKKLMADYQQRSRQRGPLFAPLRSAELASA